jgi:hypothetical protein
MRLVAPRRDVAQHRDHAASAQRQDRHDLVVIAAPDGEAVTDQPRQLGDLRDVAARLLHADDALVLRQRATVSGRMLTAARPGTL